MTQNVDSIVRYIVDHIRPKEVLVIGRDDYSLIRKMLDQNLDVRGLTLDPKGVGAAPEDLASLFEQTKSGQRLPQDYELIAITVPFEELMDKGLEEHLQIICEHSKDILLILSPSEPEVSAGQIHFPAYWTELFANKGFFRDFENQLLESGIPIARYRKAVKPVSIVVANYEGIISRLEQEILLHKEQTLDLRRELFSNEQILLGRSDFVVEKLRQIEDLGDEIDQLSSENSELRSSLQIIEEKMSDLSLARERISWEKEKRELSAKIAAVREEIEVLGAENRGWTDYWEEVQRGLGWDLLHRIRLFRLRLAPRGSKRERLLYKVFYWIREVQRSGFVRGLARTISPRSQIETLPMVDPGHLFIKVTDLINHPSSYKEAETI